MTKKEIREFENKQSITHTHSMREEDVHGFLVDPDKHKILWFTGEEIEHDLESQAEPGWAILYANEGLNGGKMPDYATWLAERYGD